MGLRLSYPSHNRDSKKGNLVDCSDGVLEAAPAFFVEFVDVVQSLTEAIIFELFYYINGYFRVYLTTMNIHSKCHTYLLY